jgi:hypothetical protein
MDQNKKSGVGIQAIPNVAIQSFLPFNKLQNKEKLAALGRPLASLRSVPQKCGKRYFFFSRKDAKE